MFPEENFFKQIVCADGKRRDLCMVTSDGVTYFEQSRNGEHFMFSVWYKDKKTGEIKLLRSNGQYAQRNRALRQHRGLSYVRSLMTTADKISAPAPRPKTKIAP